jgi:hypothetical protein
VSQGTERFAGRDIIQPPKRQTQRDIAMFNIRTTPQANVSELTADQLDMVCGGIIFVGGKVPQNGNDTVLSYGGPAPSNPILSRLGNLHVV